MPLVVCWLVGMSIRVLARTNNITSAFILCISPLLYLESLKVSLYFVLGQEDRWCPCMQTDHISAAFVSYYSNKSPVYKNPL